jgi:hypothetical protein
MVSLSSSPQITHIIEEPTVQPIAFTPIVVERSKIQSQ